VHEDNNEQSLPHAVSIKGAVLYRRAVNKMMFFLQTVLVGLARVMCMLNYLPKEKAKPAYEPMKLEDPKLQKEFKRMRIRELKYNKFQIKDIPNSNNHHICNCQLNGNSNSVPLIAQSNVTSEVSPDMSPLHLHQGLESDIREIKRYIKTIIYKGKHEENLERMRAEWRAVALVLDRLFFFLYVLSIIVSLATIFPRSA